MSEYILELKDVVKSFGSTVVLNNVQFALKKGEVHALMGENGAGKSTFIKVITGVHPCDSGAIYLDGEKVSFSNTIQSQKAGIVAVYQHATSFPELTVTENIFMGQELLTPFGTYRWKAMRQRAQKLLSNLSKTINVNSLMSELSVAEQQLVEIAKALSRDARVLIMDEPTASLTTNECEELYQIVDRLSSEGVSIIFITHRFEDMYRLAQRVTVLRDSNYIGSWDIDKISNQKLIGAMVGRELTQMYPLKTAKIGETIFEVENFSATGYFEDVAFHVKKGEILALTGLVGASRTEVCQAIYGVLKTKSGKLKLEGKEIKINCTRQALDLGVGLLPEDRHLQGLVLDLPIYQNVTMPMINDFLKLGVFLDDETEKEKADEVCKKIQLKSGGMDAKPSSLSGGNQQKVVVAKLLNCPLKVLILDEPTKGIDVGAKYSIYEIMNDLASKGVAIIMISSEMPEVLGMADRIIVMKKGRITAEFTKDEATQEKILSASVLTKEQLEEAKENESSK